MVPLSTPTTLINCPLLFVRANLVLRFLTTKRPGAHHNSHNHSLTLNLTSQPFPPLPNTHYSLSTPSHHPFHTDWSCDMWHKSKMVVVTIPLLRQNFTKVSLFIGKKKSKKECHRNRRNGYELAHVLLLALSGRWLINGFLFKFLKIGAHEDYLYDWLLL